MGAMTRSGDRFDRRAPGRRWLLAFVLPAVLMLSASVNLPSVDPAPLPRILPLAALAAPTGPPAEPSLWLREASLDPPAFVTVADAGDLPNGRVTAITEDRDGLIWLGSTDGLFRFDGHRFIRERDPDGLGLHGFIRSLASGRDGRLMVGVQGVGVFWRDPASGLFQRAGEGDAEWPALPPLDAGAFAEDSEGGVWIADAALGLFRLEAHVGARGAQRFLPGRAFRSLLLDSRGGLWAGGPTGLYHRPAAAADFQPIAGFAGHFAYALYEAADGRIWVGTQAGGSALFDPVEDSLAWLAQAPDDDGAGYPWVVGFAERVPGEMWVSTFGGGLEVRESGSGRLLRRLRHVPGDNSSLASDRVTSLWLDRAGQLWVPTWGAGLQRLPAGIEAVQRLRARPSAMSGLRNTTVTSSLPMPGEELWVGSAGVGIDVVDLASLQVVRHYPVGSGPAALPGGTVPAMARDRSDQAWVGVLPGGLLRRPPEASAFLPVAGLGPNPRVRRLLAAAEGGVWVGLENGLRRFDAGGQALPVPRTREGGVFRQAVWALAEGPDGALWVGTASGLWHSPGAEGRLERITLGDVGPGGRVRGSPGVLDLWLARDGRLWVLGQGRLYRQRSTGPAAGFEAVLTTERVPSGLGQQLFEDEAGVLWTGRVRFDPRDGRVQVLGPADGLDVGNQVWAAGSRLPDGRLVFGGSGGLVLVDPARLPAWRFQPGVVLTAIEVNGQYRPPAGDRLVLPPGPHRIAVEFAALDYSEPGMLRYRYKLEGVDRDWIETSAEYRVAAYGNLWPGDYRLRIQGSNRIGDWSPHERVLQIRVEPAFWQAPAALLLGLVLLGGLLVLATQLQGRIAARRARELERLVSQRTAELVQARDAAETALADLRGAQGRLVEAEKMASLGRMVAGVAHELNTPLGNALVVSSTFQEKVPQIARSAAEGRLKRSELDGFLHQLGEGNALIVRSLARANELVSSFKQVAVDRSLSQPRRFDLRTVVAEALEMLGPSLRQRRCRIESRVPAGIILHSDPGALGQIVANLADNAVLHAFGESGEDHEGLLRIEAVEREGPSGREVLLTFIDNGIGMDAATRRQVFDPFFTTRMGRGGTGLGLHIVYNLVVQVLGGRIRVDSAPGQGTRFELVLPSIAPPQTGGDPPE